MGSPTQTNGLDDDCDGIIDNIDYKYYLDSDGDGYGQNTNRYILVKSSIPPSGYVLDNTDCDDRNSSINPGATEVCDDVDHDCFGGPSLMRVPKIATAYVDMDGDGYGRHNYKFVPEIFGCKFFLTKT